MLGQACAFWCRNGDYLTSVIGEVAVGHHELGGLHSLPQRPHSPGAAEQHVASRPQRAQLLHASFLGAPILEPHLLRGGGKKKNTTAGWRLSWQQYDLYETADQTSARFQKELYDSAWDY